MNRIKIPLIFTAILLLLFVVVGISYALWLITDTQSNENVVSSECFDISFTEDTGSDINLLNAFPMRDNVGLSLAPYTFSIENTCDTNAAYQVNLEVLSTTTLNHDLIKTVVDDKTPSIVTDKDVVTSTIDNATSYNLETFYVAPNEVNNHEFRMWIDESGTLDNAQNKTISAKVVISAVPIDEIPTYTDPVLAGSDPVLDSKMIPVNITDTGVITVADIYDDAWYSYSESKWANVVVVDSLFTTLDPGTIIPMESIEQMYVWVPRYEYKKSSVVNASESFEINFVPISTVNTDIENNDVIVHPVFTFGGVEIAGIWVGKFEQGEDNTIKPNQNSMHSMNLSNLYNNILGSNDTYLFDVSTDLHMMKNTEWGAVAYLSQSMFGLCEDDINCTNKVENNNYSGTGYDIITGCGFGDVVSSFSGTGLDICPVENRWETTNGIKASTTHNITGIYDMAGGRSEYVMTTMYDSTNTNINWSNSGLDSSIDSDHYDLYNYNNTQSNYSLYKHGDATGELFLSENVKWNNDFKNFTNSNNTIFFRGGDATNNSDAGLWAFTHSTGSISSRVTGRSVIIIN